MPGSPGQKKKISYSRREPAAALQQATSAARTVTGATGVFAGIVPAAPVADPVVTPAVGSGDTGPVISTVFVPSGAVTDMIVR